MCGPGAGPGTAARAPRAGGPLGAVGAHPRTDSGRRRRRRMGFGFAPIGFCRLVVRGRGGGGAERGGARRRERRRNGAAPSVHFRRYPFPGILELLSAKKTEHGMEICVKHLGAGFDQSAAGRERRREDEHVHNDEQSREPVSAEKVLDTPLFCSCHFSEENAHARVTSMIIRPV